jgi:hypothetical protein
MKILEIFTDFKAGQSEGSGQGTRLSFLADTLFMVKKI